MDRQSRIVTIKCSFLFSVCFFSRFMFGAAKKTMVKPLAFISIEHIHYYFLLHSIQLNEENEKKKKEKINNNIQTQIDGFENFSSNVSIM